jgi:hypothetical protein
MMTRRRLGWLAAVMPGSAAGAVQAPKAPDGGDARGLLMNLLDGFRATQMVHVAAKLKLADHLAGGAKPVDELARLTQTHEDSLYRMLRLLAGYGVFAEEAGKRFRLTPAAELLRSGVPGSLRVQAEIVGEEHYWRPWGALLHSVRTGETGFDHLYGENTFDWMTKHPAAAAQFNALMDEFTVREGRSVVENYDFRGAKQVVDVGGGRGVLLEAILRQNPSARGVLMDLPHVLDAAKKALPAEAARRIEFRPGNFFQGIPGGGDVYTLKNIIHDWDLEKSLVILKNLRQAMPAGARLLVIENIVCGPNMICPGKTSDLTMLARTGGRNRTEAEYRELLSGNGFTVQRVIGTSPGIIEAVKN